MSLLAGGVAPACICSVVALSVTARGSGRPHPSQSEPNFPLLLVVSHLSRKRTFLCEPFEHAGDVHGNARLLISDGQVFYENFYDCLSAR